MNFFIKDNEHGHKGLFTVYPIMAGRVIIDVVANGTKVDEPERHSIETPMGHYLHSSGRYTNHSCNPTAIVTRHGTLVALRDLEPGDEITFDYTVSETSITAPFDCDCGAENCKGRVE